MNNLSTKAILIMVVTLIALILFMYTSRMGHCGMGCRCGMSGERCKCPYKMEGFDGWNVMENTSYKPLNLTHAKTIDQPHQTRLGVCEYLCRNDPRCTGFFHTTRGSIIDGGRMFPLRSCVRLNGPLDISEGNMVADTYIKK